MKQSAENLVIHTHTDFKDFQELPHPTPEKKWHTVECSLAYFTNTSPQYHFRLNSLLVLFTCRFS